MTLAEKARSCWCDSAAIATNTATPANVMISATGSAKENPWAAAMRPNLAAPVPDPGEPGTHEVHESPGPELHAQALARRLEHRGADAGGARRAGRPWRRDRDGARRRPRRR